MKIGGSRRSCSPYASGVRSVFETVPARLSGSASCKWSLRLDLHQHLTAYETAALLIVLRSEKWGDQRDLHPYRGFHRAECSTLTSWSPSKSGASGRRCPGMFSFTRGVHFSLCHRGVLGKWRSREDLHLDPPPSHGGMHGSYTSGASKRRRLLPESRRPLLLFREALISLS